MQRRIKKKIKRRHGRLSSCYRNKNPIQTFILAERTQILLSKQRWRTATETMRCPSPSFWYFGRTNPNLLGCLGLTAILGNGVTAPIQIGAYWPPGERGLAPQHTHWRDFTPVSIRLVNHVYTTIMVSILGSHPAVEGEPYGGEQRGLASRAHARAYDEHLCDSTQQIMF